MSVAAIQRRLFFYFGKRVADRVQLTQLIAVERDLLLFDDATFSDYCRQSKANTAVTVVARQHGDGSEYSSFVIKNGTGKMCGRKGMAKR